MPGDTGIGELKNTYTLDKTILVRTKLISQPPLNTKYWKLQRMIYLYIYIILKGT